MKYLANKRIFFITGVLFLIIGNVARIYVIYLIYLIGFSINNIVKENLENKNFVPADEWNIYDIFGLLLCPY